MFARNHGHGHISKKQGRPYGKEAMAHMAEHGIVSLCRIPSAYLWLLGIVAPHSSQTPDQTRPDQSNRVGWLHCEMGRHEMWRGRREDRAGHGMAWHRQRHR